MYVTSITTNMASSTPKSGHPSDSDNRISSTLITEMLFVEVYEGNAPKRDTALTKCINYIVIQIKSVNENLGCLKNSVHETNIECDDVHVNVTEIDKKLTEFNKSTNKLVTENK